MVADRTVFPSCYTYLGRLAEFSKFFDRGWRLDCDSGFVEYGHGCCSRGLQVRISFAPALRLKTKADDISERFSSCAPTSPL